MWLVMLWPQTVSPSLINVGWKIFHLDMWMQPSVLIVKKWCTSKNPWSNRPEMLQWPIPIERDLTYLCSSKTCVLWCNDSGLIWYCCTLHVFGCTLGVTYAWTVPYWPSIERIFSSSRVVLAWQRYVASRKFPSWKQTTG